MSHNNNDDNNNDGYERSVSLEEEVSALSLSQGGKVYDQKDHDTMNAPHVDMEPALRHQHDPETTKPSYKEFELEPTYRGVGGTTIHSLPAAVGLNTQSGSGPTVVRETKKLYISPPAPPSNTIKVPTEEPSKEGKIRSKGSHLAPNEPFYTLPSTSFSTLRNPGDIKGEIEVMFNSMPGISYEFFHEKFRWEGVYLVNTMRCKFEINVYRRSNGDHIVEGNRLSGDSIAFVVVYQSIYNLFSTKPAVKSKWASFGPSRPTKRRAVASDEVASIKAVITMALSPVGEAKVNAAQIFSNMASDSSKHKFLVENDCIPLLIQLMKFDFQACDQFAAIALAQLSEYPPCRQILSTNKEFLELLLPLCSTDGNYNSTEMRRKCAQLLANISVADNGAQDVVTCVGQEHVQTFLKNVDSLRDLQQRDLASISKRSLAACT